MRHLLKRKHSCPHLSFVLLVVFSCLSGRSFAEVVPEVMANVAEGKPYRLDPAPLDRYADTGGPQPFREGDFFRGELTDGKHGTTNYRAAPWVGWRDTSYREPIRVTVDLGEATWIERIEITTCGGGREIEPPQRIDVSVFSPEFPYETFVQIGQVLPGKPYVRGKNHVYRFSFSFPPCRARQVRLDFEERTWGHLFVDEIRILGRGKGPGGILPVQDLALEAEQALSGDLDVSAIKGSSGKAVLLAKAGDAVHFELPLPAGDYTLRVRSLANKADTYSELELRSNGQPMRPHIVTNNVFTWQRSHFTQQKHGTARLILTLKEGAGIYLDQLRLHLLTLNEPIRKLKEFIADTELARAGRTGCLIALDDGRAFEKQAHALASALEKRTGARVPVKAGTEIGSGDFENYQVLALGDRRNNFAILNASPNAWNSIPPPPAEGSPQLFIAVDPKGFGRNVVTIGGTDAGQVQKSMTEFLNRLEGDKTLTLPWGMVPGPKLKMPPETYRKLAIESSQWIRQGAIRRLENQWKAYGDDVFLLLAYRYIEYKDSYDTLRQISRDGFIEAELFKILCRYDRSEHHRAFTRLQRLQLTNTLLKMARQCAGIFIWDCGGGKHRRPDEIMPLLSERPPTIAHNHQTFPSYSIFTAGEYFSRYYHLPEAKQWLHWVDLFMRGQLRTSKPQCDCWGYQDITMIHTGRYAAATGQWDYFQREPVHQFLRLRFMSHDNLGGGVNYGDAGRYRPPSGPDFHASNADRWLTMTGGRFDLSRVDPQKLLGVYVHPLEPMWRELNGKGAKVLPERCFDKISFREKIDPRRAYLLLDGLSRGFHGHWDGNSILRFTDNGRIWLCEGDYLKGDPKDHNTLTFMRDAESARPGLFSNLEAQFSSSSWGATSSTTGDYCGLDWTRHLLWHRPSDTFLLVDDMAARRPGLYDMKARFRTLGKTRLKNRIWSVEQKGPEYFFMHFPGEGKLAEAADPEDANNWKAYAFADPVPKLLRHQVVRRMKAGDHESLFACFYAAGKSPSPTAEVRRVSTSAVFVRGAYRAVAGCRELDLEGLKIRAGLFAAGPGQLLLVNGRLLEAGQVRMKASAPIHLAFDFSRGQGVLENAARVEITLRAPEALGLRIDEQPLSSRGPREYRLHLEPGRHLLKGQLPALQQALAGAWQQAEQTRFATHRAGPEAESKVPLLPIRFRLDLPADILALARADLAGPNRPAILAGCADGTLVAVSPGGKELWRHRFPARVNDLAAADLDGDDREEIACAVEDSYLHVLRPDGSELWKHFFEAQRSKGGIEGHPRVILAADFDRDGRPDLAAGCANSMFYVLDHQGRQKQSNGRPWEILVRHQASAIGAADLTGDGQLELLAGYTYFGRKIADFSDGSRKRITHLGGCISGCGTIAAADVDGDGRPEAIFGDKDGQLTACRKAPADQRGTRARILWQKILGDDAISKVLARDLDRDGKPEIIVASHSGFLTLLDSSGTVQWLRYSGNQVTDTVLVNFEDKREPLIARSSIDGTVAVYSVAGEELARARFERPVQKLLSLQLADKSLLLSATGPTLTALPIDLGPAPSHLKEK